MEIWKECALAPDYLVSTLGRVVRDKAARGARRFKEAKPFVPSDGRPTVTLRVDGRTKTFRVCNLVLETFAGPRPQPRMECCHNDGNPANNDIGNLRWDTRKGNAADMVKHGTKLMGETHPSSKLTAEQVATIRKDYAAGVRQQELADRYGVHQPAISRIVNGKRW